MSRWRWFRSGWDTAISLPPRIFIRIWTTLPRFLQQKQCWTGLEWVQIRKKTLKKVWFLSRTGRFLSCYEIVKLKNSAFCIKKRYRALKKRAVPLIGGASEIWTLAALQTPYRISSQVHQGIRLISLYSVLRWTVCFLLLRLFLIFWLISFYMLPVAVWATFRQQSFFGQHFLAQHMEN